MVQKDRAIMQPKNRSVTSPGEILLEEFLKPRKLTQTQLAERMGVSLRRVNTIVKGSRSITAETAILLSRVFGNSPEFWMNLQTRFDLWRAEKKLILHVTIPIK